MVRLAKLSLLHRLETAFPFREVGLKGAKAKRKQMDASHVIVKLLQLSQADGKNLEDFDCCSACCPKNIIRRSKHKQ